MGPHPAISVIVPTLNEENNIADLVAIVRKHTTPLATEIIVVDNRSEDRTREIAEMAGADLVLASAGNVAGLRNLGARSSSGRVIIFLDADVRPTQEWSLSLRKAIADVCSRRLITGSRVRAPRNGTWIERHWFSSLAEQSSSYINSGHLIVSRDVFFALGGFNEDLLTGEDVDFSNRARLMGVDVVPDPSLAVVHEGFPRTLTQFMRREIWHGVGDTQSLRHFLSSRTAMASVLFLTLQVAGVTGAFAVGQPRWAILTLAGSLAASVVAARLRLGKRALLSVLAGGALQYLYFIARGLSPFARILGIAASPRAKV